MHSCDIGVKVRSIIIAHLHDMIIEWSGSAQVLIARSVQKGKSIASVVKESAQGATGAPARAGPSSGTQPVSRAASARPASSV